MQCGSRLAGNFAQIDAPPAPANDEAERRQLTVMFCDLVGSTALSEKLDPEDLRQILRAYQDAAGEVIQRFDGHIAQYLGDGLLVYFGYPLAYEDSARRAAGAGLSIIQAIEQLNPRLRQQWQVELAVRVAVHTGLVVAGDVGYAGMREQLAMGKTLNLAARLQDHAPQNGLVVSAATLALIKGDFDCESLGSRLLKGIAQPVELYLVRHQSKARSCLDSAASIGLTPLIGREQETRTLVDRWQQTEQGRGQVVLLRGEAGIGKSRLAQALMEHATTNPRAWPMPCQCSAHYRNTAFYPFIDGLERAILRLQRDEDASAKLHQLETFLARYGFSLPESVPLFANLLSVPLDDRYAPLHLPPERQKQLLFQSMMRVIREISARQPLLLVMEDLHWADPTSLEFLDLLTMQVPTTRTLLLCSFRPDFDPPWSGRPNLTTLTLNRLSPDEATELVRLVMKRGSFPDDLLDKIAARTDGVPLFIEELTRMLLDRPPRAGDGEAAFDLDAIPSTIQDLLLARLDQLGTAKRLAQQASCFGRTFSIRHLTLVSGLSADSLALLLRMLTASGLAAPTGSTPDEYRFKHALVQEAAYDSMLRSLRVELHRKIAESLEAELAEQEPEILAHHFGRAGMPTQEIRYWQTAGLKAMGASAFLEAASHLRNAIDRLEALREPERLPRELELRVQIAVPLTLTQGWAAPEVRQAYERAYDLCQRVEDSPLFLPVLHGMFRFYLVNGDHQAAEQIAARDLERVERTGDDGAILEFALHPGVVRFYTGRFAAALPYLKRCVSLYDVERHRDHADTYSACPATIASSHMANALAVLGQPDAAFDWNRRSTHYAAQSDHLFSRIWAMSNHAMNHILYGDHRRSAELAESMIEAAEEQGFINWLSQGRVWLGWSKVREGEVDAGLSTMMSGIELWNLTGAKLMRPFYFALLADAYRIAGRLADAEQAVDEGLSAMNKTGEVWAKPLSEILRLRIGCERTTLSPDEADSGLAALSKSALVRREALWAVRAERERILLASARGQQPDPSGLRAVLTRFDAQSPYPLLQEATRLAEHNTQAVVQ